jgi:hypothetical protein
MAVQGAVVLQQRPLTLLAVSRSLVVMAAGGGLMVTLMMALLRVVAVVALSTVTLVLALWVEFAFIHGDDMRFAIIENGVVTNIAVADSALESNWIQSDTATKGYTYENGVFTAPPEPPEPVPASVTMRQARLALNSQGLLAGVEAAIAGLSEPDKTNITIEWEYAATVERASPWIATMIAALSLTEAEMDGLFVLAATL